MLQALCYRIKKIIYIHATVESLEFIMAQYLWYSWVVHRQELTSSTKTICKRVGSFLLKLKTDAPKNHIPTYKQKSYNPGKLATRI